MDKFDFGIVIPHLGQEDFLPEALNSVLNQKGSFTVHVHVQDGGASETIEEIIRGYTPLFQSVGMRLTLLSEVDSGPAQAINRGFQMLNCEMATWLGADDYFLPGAFQAVKTLRHKYSSVSWLTGAPFSVTSEGVPISAFGQVSFSSVLSGFPHSVLKYGHFGVATGSPTIQQEGTFWTLDLWEKVGGLNESFSLAFDFDLWTRMAQFGELVQLVAPLAAFRKHPLQASNDMIEYRLEVERVGARVSRFSGHRSPIFSENARIAFVGSNTREWHLVDSRYVVWKIGQTRRKLIPVSVGHVLLRVARRVMRFGRANPVIRVAYSSVAAFRKRRKQL